MKAGKLKILDVFRTKLVFVKVDNRCFFRKVGCFALITMVNFFKNLFS